MQNNKVRIDKYLWAIRIFKTRTQATTACQHNKVLCKGNACKASHIVSVGQEYTIHTEHKHWHIIVKTILEKRVEFALAQLSYIDNSPVAEIKTKNELPQAFMFNTGKRQSKQGRPTKQQRRALDNFMDEE